MSPTCGTRSEWGDASGVCTASALEQGNVEDATPTFLFGFLTKLENEGRRSQPTFHLKPYRKRNRTQVSRKRLADDSYF